MNAASLKGYFFTQPQDSAGQKTLEVSTAYTMFTSGLLNYSLSAVVSFALFLGAFLTVAEFPLWFAVAGAVYISTASSFVMPRSGSGNAKPYAYQISAVLMVVIGILYAGLYLIPFTPYVVLVGATVVGMSFINRRLYISLKDDMWYTTLNPPTRVILTLSNASLIGLIGLLLTGQATAQLLAGGFAVPLLLFAGYIIYRSSRTVHEQLTQYQENQDEFEEAIERNKEVLKQVKRVNALLNRSDIDFQIHEPDQIDFRHADLTKIQAEAREAQELFQEEENTEGGREVIDLLQELQEYGSEYRFVIS
jgi:hypothetical protein